LAYSANYIDLVLIAHSAVQDSTVSLSGGPAALIKVGQCYKFDSSRV